MATDTLETQTDLGAYPAPFHEFRQSNALEPLSGLRHTPEQIEQALAALALNGGNARRTKRELAAQGIDVDNGTLADWAYNRFPRCYQHICNELAPRIEASIVDLHRSLALRTAQVAQHAAELEEDRILAGQVKDASASLRNLAVSSAVMTDKVLAMTGRPTTVVEHRTADQALKRLRQIAATVEGTAVEVPEEGAGGTGSQE